MLLFRMVTTTQIGVARRTMILAGVTLLAPRARAQTLDLLKIGAGRGTIDFSIGDFKIFRTTGSFKDWKGVVAVDDTDVPRSTVNVEVNTRSIEMLDTQQTGMLKDIDFFDVEKFPEMLFRSRAIERTGDATLKVVGEITLRGITRPMVLDVAVTDRKPDAPAGARYARFRGDGKIRRSDFGMTKYIDVVGDLVDISIRTDAWR